MAKPIVPWMGGKRRLSKRILPLFPEHQCYVEAFSGGAALFFLKDPSKVEVINDSNGEIVNLYRVVQNHLEEFIRCFKWSLISRKTFLWEKLKDPETLTDIQRASRFFYLQKMAFGGKVSSQTFGTATTTRPKLNLLRIEEDLSDAHLRLSNVYIESLDWHKCVIKYDRPHSLFYFDPPYWQTCGYGNEFDFKQYKLIAETMSNMDGKAVLSVNDIEEMRDVFSGFEMQSVPISYTVNGKNKRVEKSELIVKNF